MIFCFICCAKFRKKKIIFKDNREKMITMNNLRNLATDPRDKHKITDYLTKRHLEIGRKRKLMGPFIGSLTK